MLEGWVQNVKRLSKEKNQTDDTMVIARGKEGVNGDGRRLDLGW